ncbi:hypothetical protein [Paraglaciecola sp.]|uniref:hypothetical protein n=1 Tax=Paraglaciecola sp. TaxID=1920173 RepID=UPI0030F3A006
MNIYKNISQLIIRLCSRIRDFISIFLLLTLCTVAHAVPITINAMTQTLDQLIINGIEEGLDATDFCFLSTGDGNNSSALDLISDYNITPGGHFSSSQLVNSGSIGHQWEAFGSSQTSSSNLGMCFDFPIDPLGPDESFSVTIDELFLEDTISNNELLEQSGVDILSCVFSYHEEQLDPFGVQKVHYVQAASCGFMLAVLPVIAAPPNLQPVQMLRDDADKRVFTTVPEPSSIAILFASGLWLRYRARYNLR